MYICAMIQRQILKTEQKALEINLNDRIYGTFAEIGAGQEVARNFFQVGAAAGTIAKTMSAYDKTYSDAIYGTEETKRYVCESRLEKMLNHEYSLIEERLIPLGEDVCYFVFADTVQAINYQRTINGNGWMGIRFQHYPGAPSSQIVLHVKMLDQNNRQQQDAIGVLGVNLIYACYYYRTNAEFLVQSLLDGLKSRIAVDMIQASGAGFESFDDRLLNLYLVKHGLSELAIFDRNKHSIHASEVLYRKDLMVVRGHFRPPTLVTQDALRSSFIQFKSEAKDPDSCRLLAEITMDNLLRFGELDIKDYLDRTEMLCALGLSVIISDCSNHQRLISYFEDCKIERFGIVIGVHELLDIINDKYYNNQDGRLLSAFGELFSQHITVYAYPAHEKEGESLLRIDNLPIPQGIRFLFQHLIDNKQIVEVQDCNQDYLHIIPMKVFEAIQKADDENWVNLMPTELVDLIKTGKYFAYGSKHVPKEKIQKRRTDAEYY